MKVMNCIVTRRSVRKFNDKKIPADVIEEIIRAAQYAPSAKNTKPWEFMVIDDKKLLEAMPDYQQWTSFAPAAAAAIIVCANTDVVFHDENNNWSFADIDCAIASQNILLAAHDKGIGTCYCAVAPFEKTIDEIKKWLNMPNNIRPVSIIVMGYPEGEIKQPGERFRKDKIHWNNW